MQQHEPVGQRELQRDRDRDRHGDLPAGLALGDAFPRWRKAWPASLTRALPFALAGAFRRCYPALELIQPAVQRPDAFEYQRAVRGRVTLAIVRFRPVSAGRISPGRLIVFAGSRHSTSVAGDDSGRRTGHRTKGWASAAYSRAAAVGTPPP